MSAIRLLRNGLRFWRAFGTRALWGEMLRRMTTPTPPGMGAGATAAALPIKKGTVQTAQQLIAARFAQTTALPVFVVPRHDNKPRISIVTDSINKGSLFGGVGTAMILATLLVRQHAARLRIITRTEPAQPANLHSLLELYGLSLDAEVEFAFAHVQAPSAVDIFGDELFITTSWWSTESVLASIDPRRVLYVLQEDERMFYPAGDDQLRCQRTLLNEQMHVAVNTHALLTHLSSAGLPHLARTAMAFEPAFPSTVYHARPRAPQRKRRLAFYARPNHLRNLFYFGLEVIDAALARGVIDTSNWEIHFVGSHIPALSLCDGSVPERHEQLGWQQYAEFAGTVDVGLCLMYTPHPSYPPLDLAASGAVVVTNRFGIKTDLSPYCENILSAELDVDAMVQTLRDAMRLAEDEPERQRRHTSRKLLTDWSHSFAEVLERFSGKPDVWA